jgi:hypothetical protein
MKYSELRAGDLIFLKDPPFKCQMLHVLKVFKTPASYQSIGVVEDVVTSYRRAIFLSGLDKYEPIVPYNEFA